MKRRSWWMARANLATNRAKAAEAQVEELRAAGQAVVDRWDSPNWAAWNFGPRHIGAATGCGPSKPSTGFEMGFTPLLHLQPRVGRPRPADSERTMQNETHKQIRKSAG